MKKNIFLFLVLVCATYAHAQPKPTTLTKLCIDGNVQSLMNIYYHDGIILAQADDRTRLVALDAISGNQLWSMNTKMDYGVFQYGNQIIYSQYFSKNDNQGNFLYNEGWLYTLNPKNIEQKDSIKLPYTVINIASSYTESENIAIINQRSDGKFRAVIIDKKTGTEKLVLFTEVLGSTGFIPHAIQVDPADKYVALGTANGSKGFFLYDKSTGKELLNLPGAGDIQNIVFSSDSKYCFYVQKGALKVVNVTSLKLEKEIRISDKLTWVAVHPQNETIAITGFSTSAPLTTINWSTGAQHESKIFTRGGIPHYSKEGNLFIPFQGGMQCSVSPTELPYLGKVTFDNSKSGSSSTNNVTSTTNSSNPSEKFAVGSRVFIYYSGDGKHYSGTIAEIKPDGYAVVYDDGTRTTVKNNEVKSLPEITIGEKVQARRADNKFYFCLVKEIKGDIVKVEYSSGTEWVPKRDLMQFH